MTKLTVAFVTDLHMHLKNRSKSMWKWLWSNLGYYSAALWEGLRKTMNNLSYDSVLASNQNTSLKHEREYYCVVITVTVDLLNLMFM